MLCLKGLGQAPAYYLAGIGVGYKMKITASDSQVNISNVTHPQLVGSCRHKALYQVLVLTETMIGICRATRLRTLLQESEVAHDSKECITARDPVVDKHAFEHQPQLVIAYAGIKFAYLGNRVGYTNQMPYIVCIFTFLLIIRLFCFAKQSASILDCKSSMLTQAFYCLAPDFFLILMPCASAMSIIVFRARFLSSERFNCASSRLTCF